MTDITEERLKEIRSTPGAMLNPNVQWLLSEVERLRGEIDKWLVAEKAFDKRESEAGAEIADLNRIIKDLGYELRIAQDKP